MVDRSSRQLFDRMGCAGHLATVVTACASADRGAPLAQPVPLPVTVDQDTTLEGSIEQKRRIGLYTLKRGDVNLASADALQAHGEVGEVCRPVLGERDEHIHV
jgi:hypothetical protein